MTKSITRTCNLCQQRVTGTELDWVKHGEDNHPNHFLQGFAVKCPDPKFSEKKYWCPLDNKWYESRKYLARTIKEHGWSNSQYYKTYGKEFMPREWAENESDATLGNAHNTDTCLYCGTLTPFQEGKWKYPAFCGYKCSTKWYAENTDRISKAMTTLKERKEQDPNHHLRPNQTQYWVNKGLTEEEATAKVKERNAVNSLEKYIERAGGDVETGTKNWADRQERWLNSLKASGMYGGYSKVANQLFTRVSETVPNLLFGEHEKQIRCGSKVVHVDCCLLERKLVIEFYGDYWHANPKKYSADSLITVIGKSASEIWERDAIRQQALTSHGYNVLVIWESEYNSDPDATVNRCINFMRKDDVTKNSD